MQANVGLFDRIVRIALGVLLIGMSLFGVIGLWGWLGLPLVASGVFRFCFLYKLLGRNTCGCCGDTCKTPDQPK